MVVIRNLAAEGGGVRGIAFAGAWKRMEELGLARHIERLAGSSAGAIFVVAVAVGYSADEIETLLRITDMTEFKDGSLTFFGKVWDLIINYGVYKGDAFYKWIGDILAVKTRDPDITFEQVQDQFGKELIIAGSNLSTRSLELYSPTRTPTMPVRKAVRISMSIPLFFQPVTRRDKKTGTLMYLVDGGVLNNYPLGVFQQHGSCVILEETVGFKLLSQNERPDHQIYHGVDKITGVSKLIKSLINAMMLQIERLYIKKAYWERTVAIPTGDVSTTDFHMSDETKDLLYQWGYEAACDYFDD